MKCIPAAPASINFFVNSKNATFSEMNKLINFVREAVKKKTGISLDLEIEIIE